MRRSGKLFRCLAATWVVFLGTGSRCLGQEPFEHEYVVACAGDVDGDGTSEILVATSFEEASVQESNGTFRRRQDSGAAYVCSFAKRTVLARSVGEVRGRRFGHAVATIEEHGPARAATCLIGEPGFDDGRGRVAVVSAETLGLLRVLEGDRRGTGFGAQVLVPEDFTRGNR